MSKEGDWLDRQADLQMKVITVVIIVELVFLAGLGVLFIRCLM